MAWESIRAVHQDLGSAGEYAVADIIRERGHNVRVDGGRSPHDLVVDGSTTVEVKTALPRPPARGNGQRWQFKLFEDDGMHRPVEEDLLVLRCQLDRDDDTAYHYVIPGALLPELKRLDITSHPAKYAGKYSLFLGAWELLDAIVALRNTEGRQVSLPGTEPLPW